MAKIYQSELAVNLAEKCGIDSRKAQLFISSVARTIQDGLEKDRQVKIKGLGTFKVVDVDARESVNVNTGQRLVIEGHSKLTFLPDATMKELVNRPFSQFETVVLNEGVDFSDIDSAEDADAETAVAQEETSAVQEEAPTVQEEAPIVQEEAPAVQEEVPVVQEEAPVVQEEAPAVQEEVPVVQEELQLQEEETSLVEEESTDTEDAPVFVEEGAAGAEEEPIVTEEEPTTTEEEQVVEEATVEESAAEELAGEEIASVEDEPLEHEFFGDPAPRSRGWWKYLVFSVLALAIGFCSGYFVGKHNAQPHAAVASAATSAAETAGDAQQNDVPDVAPSTSEDAPAETTIDTASTQEEGVDEEPIWEKYNNMDRRTHDGFYYIMGLDHIEVAREGDTPARMAKRVFGATEMACYIEVFNGFAPETTVLDAGTEVKIPKVEPKRVVKKRLKQQQNNQ